MLHWIGRFSLEHNKVKPLQQVESEEAAWALIHELNSKQDQINKENNRIHISRWKINNSIPRYNADVHGSIKQYIKFKKEYIKNLSEEDREVLDMVYIKRIIPLRNKLVYLAVHEVQQ